mmetsp:Transcript_11112/g.34233  ORF Transcript_11112/g.34233 Transcript_11112/m.34233 type:complete len:245 (-) Transcript_11112:445-1179(-)
MRSTSSAKDGRSSGRRWFARRISSPSNSRSGPLVARSWMNGSNHGRFATSKTCVFSDKSKHAPSRHVPRLSGAPTAPVSHGVWMPGSPRQLKFSLKAGQSVSLRHARAVLLSTRGTERRPTPLSGHRRSAALPSGDSVSRFGPSTMQTVPSASSIANCCALKSSNMYPRDAQAPKHSRIAFASSSGLFRARLSNARDMSGGLSRDVFPIGGPQSPTTKLTCRASSENQAPCRGTMPGSPRSASK